MKRLPATALIAVLLSFVGCTTGNVDFQAGKASFGRFATDAAVESFEYTKPDGTVIKVGGYNSQGKIEALQALLETLK